MLRNNSQQYVNSKASQFAWYMYEVDECFSDIEIQFVFLIIFKLKIKIYPRVAQYEVDGGLPNI